MIVLSSCGPDPRLNFVGGYKGTKVDTLVYNGGTPTLRSSEVEFAISAPDNTRTLRFEWRCNFIGTTSDGENIKIDPLICFLGRLKTKDGDMADYTDDFEATTGKLSNGVLSFTMRGVEIGDNYSDDNTKSYRWVLESKVSATKK